MYMRQFGVVTVMFCLFAQYAVAGEYQISWKSDLPEGALNRCGVSISGVPVVGPAALLRQWKGISFPFYAFIPEDFHRKLSYSPPSGCSSLVVDISCHSKPEGSEWRQKLTIAPCQDRTVLVGVDGARLQ